MVGRGFGAWVDTWSSSPPLVSHVSVGYGGAWLARVGWPNDYILKFKPSLLCPSQQTNKSRPKVRAKSPAAPPKGPRRNPNPPEW
ncbi:hypothetical protein Hanom_Chr09g00857231 [Helianthus anomalus]